VAQRKSKQEGKKGAPEYMLTYGDMMTLLVCFFVLLLAMSQIDPAKFKIAASSFQNALSGVLKEYPTMPVFEEILIPRLGGEQQNKRLAIEAVRRIRQTVSQQNLQDAIKVKVTETGVAVLINDPFGFDAGKAEVKPQFVAVVEQMAEMISTMPDAFIRVEGHTDNVPISTPYFPSNWELSAARALNVVKILADKKGIDPAKLSAVGYGEYRPRVSNTTAENRQKNRRIEMYIDYTKSEQRQ